MKPSLLILAAGIGSRYGSLKQIDKFGPSGETIIDYSIYDAIRAGFGKVVFVISRSIEEEFKATFENRFPNEIEVDYVLQEIDTVPEGIHVPPDRERPWGTGHAVLVAASKIKEPFVVINADDFYGAGSYKIISAYLSEDRADYCIVGYKLVNTLSEYGYVSRGICERDDNGYLISVTERTHISKTQYGIAYQDAGDNLVGLSENAIASMNMMGFTPSVFEYCKTYFEEFIRENSHNLKAEFYLPYIVNTVVKTNTARVKLLNTNEKWFGVTYKEDKAFAKMKIRELVAKGIYPENLWGR